MVFVDTSGWYAYFVPTDANHRRVRECAENGVGPLVTTDYCVDETLTLLLMRREHRRALEAGCAFFPPIRAATVRERSVRRPRSQRHQP